MSEYQHYAFRAIDKPLSESDKKEIEKWSLCYNKDMSNSLTNIRHPEGACPPTRPGHDRSLPGQQGRDLFAVWNDLADSIQILCCATEWRLLAPPTQTNKTPSKVLLATVYRSRGHNYSTTHIYERLSHYYRTDSPLTMGRYVPLLRESTSHY